MKGGLQPIPREWSELAVKRIKEGEAKAMRVIYLSGPMMGYPENNFPAFNSAARQLRDYGHRVYNPAEFPNNWTRNADVRKAFASYCTFICLEADTIVLLPGYKNSSGAQIELGLARKVGLKIYEFHTDLNANNEYEFILLEVE